MSCRLPTCGALRGNGAPASERATWASCRPCGDREVSRRPQSCPTRPSGKRSAPLRPRSAPRWRFLVEFVASRLRACGSASASLPFAVRPLPPPASANHRAWLRRRIRLLAPRVLRGAYGEPRPPVSLRSALGRPARSSRNVLFCEAAQAAFGPEEPIPCRSPGLEGQGREVREGLVRGSESCYTTRTRKRDANHAKRP